LYEHTRDISDIKTPCFYTELSVAFRVTLVQSTVSQTGKSYLGAVSFPRFRKICENRGIRKLAEIRFSSIFYIFSFKPRLLVLLTKLE